MPCDVAEHRGYHNWPDQGELRIWPCERSCDYCDYHARDSSNLRSHVREVHAQPTSDYPHVTIQAGLNRPPMFNPKLHGTKPRAPRPPSPHQSDEEEVTEGSEEQDDFEDQKPSQSLEPDGRSRTGSQTTSPVHEGPTSARGRKIQVTPKAAAAAAEEASRKKRKRGEGRMPGEIFPARLPKTKKTRPDDRYFLDHDMDSAVRVRRSSNRLNRDPRSEAAIEELYAKVKGNLAGLLLFADAAGLDRGRTYAACQEAMQAWMYPAAPE